MRTHPPQIQRTLEHLINYPRTFVVVVAAVIALTTGGALHLTLGPPAAITSHTDAVVVESSRDINERPMAVAELPDGTEEFIPGTYTAGEPVTVALTASGDIATGHSIGFHYVLLVITAALTALVAIPIAMMTFDRIEWRTLSKRRTYLHAHQW